MNLLAMGLVLYAAICCGVALATGAWGLVATGALPGILFAFVTARS